MNSGWSDSIFSFGFLEGDPVWRGSSNFAPIVCVQARSGLPQHGVVGTKIR